MTASRVLITGISGFTGRPLARLLRSKGLSVYGFANSDVDSEVSDLCDGVTIGSIVDYAAIDAAVAAARPDYVIHLAAIAYTAHANATPYYDVNVIGTENLLQAVKAHAPDVQKVILASSAAVYGKPLVDCVSESAKIAPISHYGLSKLTMEHLAQIYADAMPIVITRPFNYTGPGQPHYFLIPKIIKHFAAKAPVIELGNIHVIREFGDVRDAVSNYAALLDSGATGVVNLCSGQAHRVSDVIDSLRDKTGHQIDVQVNPDFIRESDIERLVGDPARLKSMTGLSYQYSLQETLQLMLDAQ